MKEYNIILLVLKKIIYAMCVFKKIVSQLQANEINDALAEQKKISFPSYTLN